MPKPVCRAWIDQVINSPPTDECILWPFHTRSGRWGGVAYPAIADGYAHVELCELVHGLRPTKSHVVHRSCGNSLCMNPAHLSWARREGTVKCRGGHLRGQEHPQSTLTADEVREIRGAENMTYSELSALYGVSVQTISNIRLRKTWRHLP